MHVGTTTLPNWQHTIYCIVELKFSTFSDCISCYAPGYSEKQMLEDVHRDDLIEGSDGSDAESNFIEDRNEVPEIIDGQSDEVQ